MPTEYQLDCTVCGGRLTERRVGEDALSLDVSGHVDVAECTDCGSRHFPEQTLERL